VVQDCCCELGTKLLPQWVTPHTHSHLTWGLGLQGSAPCPWECPGHHLLLLVLLLLRLGLLPLQLVLLMP
jgi:hypothetical protein